MATRTRLPWLSLLLAAVLSAPVARGDEGIDEPAGETEGPLIVVAEPGAGGAGAATLAVWDTVSFLGRDVAPGERHQLTLHASESFAGASIDIPVLVLRGQTAGPTLCLTAGVHGDELNGIEIVRKLFEHATPKELSGMLVGIPVVNLHGFRRNSRYLPDRRDLNRYFPGHPAGSSASRIANALFEGVIGHCSVVVDFHTGSFHRSNLPQVRGHLRDMRIFGIARSFGVGVAVHSEGTKGTLRRATTDAGIPAITYEAGEPMRFRAEEIKRGVEGIRNLMADLGMLSTGSSKRREEWVYFQSRWVRVNDGGIFLTDRSLGDRVSVGDLLGTVTDPVSNERAKVLAPFSGRIIGMAFSQVVIPGFAAFHIGIDSGSQVAPAAPVLPPAPPAAPAGSSPTPDQLDAEESPE